MHASAISHHLECTHRLPVPRLPQRRPKACTYAHAYILGWQLTLSGCVPGDTTPPTVTVDCGAITLTTSTTSCDATFTNATATDTVYGNLSVTCTLNGGNTLDEGTPFSVPMGGG